VTVVTTCIPEKSGKEVKNKFPRGEAPKFEINNKGPDIALDSLSIASKRGS